MMKPQLNPQPKEVSPEEGQETGTKSPSPRHVVNIPPEVATHEAGHLVVGLHLGLDEHGICFGAHGPNEAAGAWFSDTRLTPRLVIVRAFAGLLAHLELLPDSIQPHLRRAYLHSIIINPDHPHYNDLTAEERGFLSGARGDMQRAWASARTLHPDNEQGALSAMSEAENESRKLVSTLARRISRVVADIVVWAAEPEREVEQLLFYGAERARSMNGET